MSDLAGETCEACRPDAPTLGSDELAECMKSLPHWTVLEVDGIKQLQRVFSFSNFVDAMAFANKVGELAEEFDHHPALLVEWGRVSVSWWSHKIKGLHRTDAILAAKTDLLVTQ